MSLKQKSSVHCFYSLVILLSFFENVKKHVIVVVYCLFKYLFCNEIYGYQKWTIYITYIYIT